RPSSLRTTTLGGAREEIVFYDVPKCCDSVLPNYLLAFRIRTALVENRHLIETDTAQSCNLSCNFQLKSKTVFTQPDFLKDFATKYFVTHLNIREVEIRADVRKRRDNLVADEMPVIEHAVRLGTEKTRTK